jgi:hypothetical protein
VNPHGHKMTWEGEGGYHAGGDGGCSGATSGGTSS